jgi:hypothetical protein
MLYSMKKLLPIALAFVVAGLASTSTAQARVNVSLGFGFYPGWCSRPVYYPSPVYYYSPAPPVVYTQAPVPAPVAVTTTSRAVPYGYLVSPGTAKSPWSDFTLPTGGKSSGQVVYDANNGKAFRVP